MNRQLCLPGCEAWFAPADPMPRGTLRVAEVIAGYSRGAWGECRAFYRTIAGVKGLRKSVRWLAERIAWLQKHGILRVFHRGPHAAILRLAENFAELLKPVLISESTSDFKTQSAPMSARKEEMAGEQAPPEKTGPASNWWREHMEPLLRRCAGRIQRAKNPAAYRQAIITIERNHVRRSEQLRLRPLKPKPAVCVMQISKTLPIHDFFNSLTKCGLV